MCECVRVWGSRQVFKAQGGLVQGVLGLRVSLLSAGGLRFQVAQGLFETQ